MKFLTPAKLTLGMLVMVGGLMGAYVSKHLTIAASSAEERRPALHAEEPEPTTTAPVPSPSIPSPPAVRADEPVRSEPHAPPATQTVSISLGEGVVLELTQQQADILLRARNGDRCEETDSSSHSESSGNGRVDAVDEIDDVEEAAATPNEAGALEPVREPPSSPAPPPRAVQEVREASEDRQADPPFVAESYHGASRSIILFRDGQRIDETP